MIRYKGRTKNSKLLSLLITITILAHLILTPLAYNRSLETASGIPKSSFALSGDIYIINEVKNYELLSDVKIKSIVSKALRDFERLLNKVLDNLLQPIITILVLFIYTLSYYKKIQQRKSLLAFSLGGHAPPFFEQVR